MIFSKDEQKFEARLDNDVMFACCQAVQPLDDTVVVHNSVHPIHKQHELAERYTTNSTLCKKSAKVSSFVQNYCLFVTGQQKMIAHISLTSENVVEIVLITVAD